MLGGSNATQLLSTALSTSQSFLSHLLHLMSKNYLPLLNVLNTIVHNVRT